LFPHRTLAPIPAAASAASCFSCSIPIVAVTCSDHAKPGQREWAGVAGGPIASSGSGTGPSSQTPLHGSNGDDPGALSPGSRQRVHCSSARATGIAVSGSSVLELRPTRTDAGSRRYPDLLGYISQTGAGTWQKNPGSRRTDREPG
jgi:hypothetical protein